MKITALCTSSYSHQLDHLAPLASTLEIPLILTDPDLFHLCQKYYPSTNVVYTEEKECSLEYLSHLADLLILSCKHWARELAFSFHTLYQKKMRFCYAPHGNSDKGSLNPASDLLFGQDLSLIYGDHMKEMLKKRGVLSSLQGTVLSGNYRLHHYHQHQDFYDTLVNQEVFSLFEHPSSMTFLYAPTWNDSEHSSSFFKAIHTLLDALPTSWNLLVKLHPNLERDDPAKVYRVIAQYESKKNIVFLTNYPPVYPILNKVAGYIGDFSSVGYDFLYFNRPMFFINADQRDPHLDEGLSLFKCGKILDLSSPLWIEQIEQELLAPCVEWMEKRKRVYDYTFDSKIDYSTIKASLIALAHKTDYSISLSS